VFTRGGEEKSARELGRVAEGAPVLAGSFTAVERGGKYQNLMGRGGGGPWKAAAEEKGKEGEGEQLGIKVAL